MRAQRLLCLVAVVAAAHVAALSLVLGVRHPGYLLAATLSATAIWGAVFRLGDRRRRRLCLVGVVAGLAVQQLAYQMLREDLPGFWWSLAQFAAVHLVAACGIGRGAS